MVSGLRSRVTGCMSRGCGLKVVGAGRKSQVGKIIFA